MFIGSGVVSGVSLGAGRTVGEGDVVSEVPVGRGIPVGTAASVSVGALVGVEILVRVDTTVRAGIGSSDVAVFRVWTVPGRVVAGGRTRPEQAHNSSTTQRQNNVIIANLVDPED